MYSEYALRSPRAKAMIRSGRYKYSYYVGDIAELFDLETDPDEMVNLALSPEYASAVELLREQLFAWHRPA